MDLVGVLKGHFVQIGGGAILRGEVVREAGAVGVQALEAEVANEEEVRGNEHGEDGGPAPSKTGW